VVMAVVVIVVVIERNFFSMEKEEYGESM